MRVRATAQGYFEGFREVGAEFDVQDNFSGPWFVPVEQPAAVIVDEPEPEAEPEAEPEKKTRRRKSY